MALEKCKECGKEISSTAKQCPQCGYKEKHTEKNIVIAFLCFLFIGVIFILIGTKIFKNVEEMHKYKEYDELFSKTKQMMFDNAQKYERYCIQIQESVSKDPVNGAMNYSMEHNEELKNLWDNYDDIKNNMKKLKEIPEASYKKSYDKLNIVYNGLDNLNSLTMAFTNDYKEKCDSYSVTFNEEYEKIK